MKKLGTIELAKRKMSMRVRAALRLKAAEQYLDDVNEALPEMEKRFDKNVQQGRLPKPIDLVKVLGD